MFQVGYSQRHDRHYCSGMFLIFRDAFAVSVAFGVPDLTVVEVVSFDVLFVEGDGRDCFDSKNDASVPAGLAGLVNGRLLSLRTDSRDGSS